MIEHLKCNPVTGKLDDSFVGLHIYGNKIDFYYPESFRFDESNDDDTKKSVISFLKTLEIAKSNKKVTNNEIYTKRVEESNFALNSYLWIIKDFLKNGIYLNREKVYKLNKNGKVNWKKTLQNNPIVSNGNIIYKDIVVETKSNVENLLVEIHKYCVKKSIDFIGWLFNLKSDFLKIHEINDSIKKQYLIAITTELSHTFEDDKKMRLNNMKNVIQGLDSNLMSSNIIYGINSYHYVFEKMIDSIFSNRNVKDFYPQGKWDLIKPQKISPDSSNLRPDTIFVHENDDNTKDLYILDSKYYRYGCTGDPGDLPYTSSIQKQIAYGEFISNNKKSEYSNIYNAFILPFDKTSKDYSVENNMIYVGAASVDSNKCEKSYEKVYTFLIDLRHVIDTYNNYSHKDDTDTLIAEISKLLEK